MRHAVLDESVKSVEDLPEGFSSPLRARGQCGSLSPLSPLSLGHARRRGAPRVVARRHSRAVGLRR